MIGLPQQQRLVDLPVAGLYPIEIDIANELLVAWEHKLGPVNRPFRQEAFGLYVADVIVAVAVSASSVNHIRDYRRTEIVELARLAASERWANRVMLRLWRELCAPRWACWPVKAAISYSKNSMHSGDLYRFDGWEKITDKAGSSGGGSWSRQRYATDITHGTKSLWLWRYVNKPQ